MKNSRKTVAPGKPEAGRLLREVAADARLQEGPEGVRRILREVFRTGATPIRDLARHLGLPVPVVAAVRGELEKRGLLVRAGGMALSEAGQAAVREELGLSCRRRFARSPSPELPPDMDGVLARMREICAERPDVDVTLDQSHATPETALRRAVYMFEHDALEGRDVLVLGDDDLTSVAVGLVAEFLGLRLGRVTVLECDPRLVAFLLEYGQEAISHDLRSGLPTGLAGGFDAFLTDPPYTLAGLEVFVSRGVVALRPDVGKQGFLCFGHRTPSESALAIAALADMGLAPVEIIPEFNRYDGAQVLAGVSQMIRTVSTGAGKPRVAGAHAGALYTADRKRDRKRHER